MRHIMRLMERREEKTMTRKVPTWCVPSAIFCALAWLIKERVPTRIAVQKLSSSEDHAQAEALINGEWTPLTEIWDGISMAVVPYRRHYPHIAPYRTPTLREFIDEQMALFDLPAQPPDDIVTL